MPFSRNRLERVPLLCSGITVRIYAWKRDHHLPMAEVTSPTKVLAVSKSKNKTATPVRRS